MYDPLQVNLPYFDGPLDLLLHLVRKQELDIQELRLSELTKPYLAYLDQIQDMNLDQGGEFLAIAATLVWIKSRTLLPREVGDEEELDPETLEEMLLLRLQEYQMFKEAAVDIAARDMLGRDLFPRQAPDESPPPAEGDQEFEEVSLFHLIEAFRKALERAETVTELHIIPERERIEDKVAAMFKLLAGRKDLYMTDFFADNTDRANIILTFIALLEMVRLKMIRITQSSTTGPIYCQSTEDFQERGQDYKKMILTSLYGDEMDGDEMDKEELEGEQEEEGAEMAPPTLN